MSERLFEYLKISLLALIAARLFDSSSIAYITILSFSAFAFYLALIELLFKRKANESKK